MSWSRSYYRMLKIKEAGEGPLICLYCDCIMVAEPSELPNSATVDHLVPIKIAPKRRYDITNMALCCRACNEEKDSMHPKQWARTLEKRREKRV